MTSYSAAEQPRPARRDPYLPYRRTLLPAATVRELSRRRPARVIADTAICWAIIVSAWLLAAALDRWWVTAMAVVVVGNRFYALFIIGHDGMHRRLFTTTRANDLFNDLLIFGHMGAITRINNRNHLQHHQNLSTSNDPDRRKHACENKNSPVAVIGYLTGVASVLGSVKNVFVNRGVHDADRDATPRPRYSWRDLLILVGCQGALIGMLTWLFGWWGYPVLWLLPVYCFMFLADNLRAFVEHSQTDADEVADSHRLVTNEPGWIERELLAPMHMNFHAAHHLWPSIPYYNLPKANAEMRRSEGAADLTWRGSYLGYLWHYLRSVPIDGCSRAVRGA